MPMTAFRLFSACLLPVALLLAAAGCTAPQPQASSVSDSNPPAMNAAPGFIHMVYFWMKEDATEADKAQLLQGIRTLGSISTLRLFHVGTPAMTPREVVDNTYAFGLLTAFDDKAGQDAYQVDPVHLAFVEQYKHLWTRVQIYDTLVE